MPRRVAGLERHGPVESRRDLCDRAIRVPQLEVPALFHGVQVQDEIQPSLLARGRVNAVIEVHVQLATLGMVVQTRAAHRLVEKKVGNTAHRSKRLEKRVRLYQGKVFVENAPRIIEGEFLFDGIVVPNPLVRNRRKFFEQDIRVARIEEIVDDHVPKRVV